MKSPAAQLVHARVMHARLRPVFHRFVYPVFYVRVNLARLEDCQSAWFGINRRRPLSIRTRDYGPRDGSDLQQWMRAAGYARHQGRWRNLAANFSARLWLCVQSGQFLALP